MSLPINSKNILILYFVLENQTYPSTNHFDTTCIIKLVYIFTFIKVHTKYKDLISIQEPIRSLNWVFEVAFSLASIRHGL